MTNTPAPEPWVNRFGTLDSVRMIPLSNGQQRITGVLRSVNRAGKGFDTPFSCFHPGTIKAILDAGNGAYISLRGPIEQVPARDGRYSVPTFKAIVVNPTRVADPAATRTKITENMPF